MINTQKTDQTTKSTVIVASRMMQTSLSVLLQAEGICAPIVCTANAVGLESTVSPRLVILATKVDVLQTQIQQVRHMWKQAQVLVLAHDPRHHTQLRQHGADAVLLYGVSPQRLLQTISTLVSRIPSQDYIH